MKQTKLYLITYDPNTNFNSSNFHDYIEDMDKKGWISDWWHYIKSSYIVASTYSANELYNAAVNGMGGIKHILIVQIDPKNEQGWLPSEAWSWLKKYQ